MNAYGLNIAVSGLNASDNPGPGVPVIRSIRESKEFKGIITGFAYDPLDPGIYMREICDNVFLLPYPSEGAENLLDRIRQIHDRTPIDVIISTLDSEFGAYLKIIRDLNEMGIHMLLPTEEALKLRAKSHLHELIDIGINVPKGKAVVDLATVYKLESFFNFPVLVKGQFYEAYMAYSVMDAVHHFNRVSYKWGLPVIIQEFINGVEYDIVGLGDGKGGVIGAVPMKKMQLTDKGKAWGGITIDDPELNGVIRDIIRKLKWQGPCELEIMKEKGTGKYYLIEVNPRFPAWCYLSVAAGQNLPWAAVKLALSETVHEFTSYEVGVLFLRNSVDCVYPLSEYQSVSTKGELIRTRKND